MSITAHLFDSFLSNALGSVSAGGAPNCDLLSDNIYCALLSSAACVQGTDDFWNDRVANEVASGGGYTTNGKILAGKSLAIGGHVITFDDSADLVWTSATFDSYQLAIVDRTPATDATRPLIGYVDFGGVVTVASGTLTFQWSASGIFTITMA